MKKIMIICTAIFVIIATSVCLATKSESDDNTTNNTDGTTGDNIQDAADDTVIERIAYPAIYRNQLETVVDGNNEFALDFYQYIRQSEDENFFYSPYSISAALAMCYVGAENDTADEMEEVLHFGSDRETTYTAFNYIDQELMSRGSNASGRDGEPFRLNVANRIWGQIGLEYEIDFLNNLILHFGAGMGLVNYSGNPEQARIEINQWVSDQTEEKIPELLQPRVITGETMLVLTNAIYFNAAWNDAFSESATCQDSFYLNNGEEISVEMMNKSGNFDYYRGNDFSALELPYEGNEISMVIILPNEGELENVEQSINAQTFRRISNSLRSCSVDIEMPKWESRTKLELAPTLQAMGMEQAFSYYADFSGIRSERDLFISHVIHEAFIKTDELGTEAAAATAVVMSRGMGVHRNREVIEFHIERPFIYYIRDIETDTVIFIGRILNPNE